jgi:hypothetical protein
MASIFPTCSDRRQCTQIAFSRAPIPPISLPTKFELVINLTTAKELDIDVPMSLMVRADEMLD